MSKFDWYLVGLAEGVGYLVLFWTVHKLLGGGADKRARRHD